ncbi:MAG: ribulokinase [Melioribacteraceae bacterium]|nr:ribulokinase [Melioribacteraceae bacterium]
MNKYTIGLDFGTNSCRALLVNISNGNEIATSVFAYPSGVSGVIIDEKDSHLARQNPSDYLVGIENTIKNIIAIAKTKENDFGENNIIGIGVDTTGSSPMPIDANGNALCSHEEFKDNLSAYVWLWKDHTSYNEAKQITELAEKIRPQYLSKIGGVYSSEWWWSKILHCKNISPEVYNAAYSWAEICDWIPAVLVGNTKPENIKRSICAAGHKALFNYDWGGLPDKDFLNMLSDGLGDLRDRLYSSAYTSENKIGNLSEEWAKKLGLTTDVVVSVGAFDAHMAAVGAGIKEGTLVKIIGTSTCDIMISPKEKKLKDVPGVCGIVDGSVENNFYGIEAGQSAVGDILLWFVNNLVPDNYGKTTEEKFKNLEIAASKLKPGESGLLALDWNNGNRTILVDVRLTGLLIGQTLHTQPHEIYRALIEATAFGALTIIDRIEEYGVKINDVINCGGLAVKNSLLMQIYADVTNRPMKISGSEQTPALGAAIFASLAAGKNFGGYDSIDEATSKMTSISKIYFPIQENVLVYNKLYKLYKQLHDSFGTKEWTGNMFNVMKELLNIRDDVIKGKLC